MIIWCDRYNVESTLLRFIFCVTLVYILAFDLCIYFLYVLYAFDEISYL